MRTFAVPYERTPSGLAEATSELARRRQTHAAFAGQPDITPIWQDWTDWAARDVTRQAETVRRLSTICVERRHEGTAPGERGEGWTGAHAATAVPGN